MRIRIWPPSFWISRKVDSSQDVIIQLVLAAQSLPVKNSSIWNRHSVVKSFQMCKNSLYTYSKCKNDEMEFHKIHRRGERGERDANWLIRVFEWQKWKRTPLIRIFHLLICIRIWTAIKIVYLLIWTPKRFSIFHDCNILCQSTTRIIGLCYAIPVLLFWNSKVRWTILKLRFFCEFVLSELIE